MKDLVCLLVQWQNARENYENLLPLERAMHSQVAHNFSILFTEIFTGSQKINSLVLSYFTLRVGGQPHCCQFLPMPILPEMEKKSAKKIKQIF